MLLLGQFWRIGEDVEIPVGLFREYYGGTVLDGIFVGFQRSDELVELGVLSEGLLDDADGFCIALTLGFAGVPFCLCDQDVGLFLNVGGVSTVGFLAIGAVSCRYSGSFGSEPIDD